MLRTGAVALSVLLFGSIGAGAAGASTLVVDDNRAQCPAAGFSSIQAAVVAASAGDTINVCPGTYAEQVFMPASKPGLVVQATQRRLATVLSPKRFVDGSGNDSPLRAIVVAAGARDVVRGLRILGQLAPNPSCGGTFTHDVGVQVGGNLALVQDNEISDIRDNCGAGSGIWVGDAEDEMLQELGGGGAIIRDNLIQQYRGAGVIVEAAQPPVRILDNTITGAQSRPNTGIFGGQEGSLDVEGNLVNGNQTAGISLAGAFVDEDHVVSDNQIRGNGVGIATGGFLAAPALIAGNTISASRADGILDGSQANTIRDNLVEDNGANGVDLQSSGGTVRSNQLLRNRGAGILAAGSGYTIDRNTALSNVGRDCQDTSGPGGPGTLGTLNLWTNDRGRTSSPAGLCTLAAAGATA